MPNSTEHPPIEVDPRSTASYTALNAAFGVLLAEISWYEERGGSLPPVTAWSLQGTDPLKMERRTISGQLSSGGGRAAVQAWVDAFHGELVVTKNSDTRSTFEAEIRLASVLFVIWAFEYTPAVTE